MGRILLVVLFFLVFLGGVTTYLCIRLVTPMSLPSPFGWMGIAVMIAAVLFMVGSMFAFRMQQSSVNPPKALVLYQEAGYLVMGFLAFVLTFVVLRDMGSLVFALYHRWVGLPGSLVPWVMGAKGYQAQTAVILILSALCSAWAMYLCFHPEVKRVELRYPKLSPALVGLRIVMISDIHVGPWFRRPFVERVGIAVKGEKPDILVLAGDVADGLPRHLEWDAAPLGELRGRLGTFYVTGNHEYYWNAPAWIAHMGGLGYTVLNNASQEVAVGDGTGATIHMVGVADFQSLSFPGEGKTDFKAAFRNVTPGKDFCVAVVHQPKGAETAVGLGADLVLSGHTHGGQFFPGTVVIKWAQKYVAGLYRLGDRYLYVGRGTGAWGPPMRLGARGEVAVVTLIR